MSQPFTPETFELVKRVIESRRTFKVMGDPQAPVKIDSETADLYRPIVTSAIASADWAPFHYDRALDNVPQPWRVTLLWHESCQKIAANFYEWFDDVKPGNKLPAMLGACGACVLVSWLPQFESGKAGDDSQQIAKSKQIQIDSEHLAATSAYVQNLMLLLTAANMGTYWSSGGQFCGRAMMDRLGMPEPQQLLAAVFVEFPDTNDAEVQRVSGKLADKRAGVETWLKVVNL